MTKAINSDYVMKQDEINDLKSEFNKDKNIMGKIPDIGELLRAEIIKGGKKQKSEKIFKNLNWHFYDYLGLYSFKPSVFPKVYF